MNRYEVANTSSATILGTFEADTPAEAIEAACRDAGYASRAAAEEVMGHDCELIATQQ